MRSESDNISSLGILTRKFKRIELSLGEYQISAQLDQHCELCYATLNNLVQIIIFGQYAIPVHSGHIRREQGSSVQIILRDPRSSIGVCRLPGTLEMGQITLSVTITFCVRSGSETVVEGCTREPEAE